ncbi:MAG: hypothetical protein ACI8QI_001626 [Limisphaerales bacterium]|jgi:hypothetical protein
MPKKGGLVLAAVIAIGGCAFMLRKQATRNVHDNTPSTYTELTALSESDLSNVNIALINLLCAEGLPGAESLNVKQSLKVLDQWTALVKQAERKYRPQFHRDPIRYDNSLAKFKAVNLGLTLKQDLGCDYNMDLVKTGAMADIHSTHFFRDSTDLFLHGFTEKRKGSCASLPVLMVAIGRRCGYPLYLASSKGHLFCRWDDGVERFNIETAIEGVDSKPDSYYRRWPHPFDDDELKTEKYLKSLSPAEELGVFVQIRAACLEENWRLKEAAQAYRIALRSFPKSKYVGLYLNNLKGEY